MYCARPRRLLHAVACRLLVGVGLVWLPVTLQLADSSIGGNVTPASGIAPATIAYPVDLKA
ncbi:hypothetical protein D3C72_2110200 [compost metagenome]